MIPYKGAYAETLRYYIKNKFYKWGFKLLVRAGASGFIYGFIPYQKTFALEQLQGRPNELTEDEIDMGLGAAIVIALSKTLYESQFAIVYFDHYSISFPLLVYLKKKFGILSLSTFKGNRIAGCLLLSYKVTMKRRKGELDYKTDHSSQMVR